ncbi:MAG: DUF4398 domain-containing protein [Pseudomonadaceae bacterium]|nr:MAG: DUF4398 domain-containing protein [Pseudomonadaceae bacterium]
MNAILINRKLLLGGAVVALLAGCATAPGMTPGASEARNNLSRLQADPQLASRAPLAMRDAEAAVSVAEQPDADRAVGQHKVLMADRKVEIARAQAQTRLYEDQREQLSKQREGARLDSRTQEADQSRAQAGRLQAETDSLKAQLAALQAKETERGMVITLGDVLFATGGYSLRGGTAGDLNRLAVFMQENPERSLVIEGHTDSVGSNQSNQVLSQQRADTVKRYLQSQGVAANRLAASGLGEGSPVADNGSASGRQQNRRVEVIISHR